MIKDMFFHGLIEENPFEHIQHFNDICDLYKTKGVTDVAFKLRAFPFTLQGDAKVLIRKLPPDSIRTFQDLTNEFINHFFPPSKVERLRMEINGFTQRGTIQEDAKSLPTAQSNTTNPNNNQASSSNPNNTYAQVNSIASTKEDQPEYHHAFTFDVKENEFDLDDTLESDTNDLGVFKFSDDSEDAKFIPYQVKSVMSMEATESTYKEIEGGFERIKLGKVKKELKFENVLNAKEQKNEVEVLATTTKEKNETSVSHPQPLSPPHPKDVDCKSTLTDNENIYVKLPLSEVLENMPNYGKFLKTLMAKKGDVDQASTAFLKNECDEILKKCNLPPKMGDLGPFLILCNINGSEMFTSLADSGASINFMHYSIYKRLGLGDLSPTTMGVKLIDQSVCSSVGIAEDLIVKVGDMEFPIDFVIVDIKEDPVVPLVLGRPFLATASSFFEFRTGKLTLRDKGKCMSIRTKFIKSSSTPLTTPQIIASMQCITSTTQIGSSTKDQNDVIDKSMKKLYGRVHRLHPRRMTI
ncbi:uncharacterized protein [Rutidosis leptorrhynchoides]|uniref:uncharacterized protein n=1 Tax=Rutidosis leptorrhynchoides TaxID=125765 RepID=UPI003A992895